MQMKIIEVENSDEFKKEDPKRQKIEKDIQEMKQFIQTLEKNNTALEKTIELKE